MDSFGHTTNLMGILGIWQLLEANSTYLLYRITFVMLCSYFKRASLPLSFCEGGVFVNANCVLIVNT